MDELNIMQMALNLLQAGKERLEVLGNKGVNITKMVNEIEGALNELEGLRLIASVKASLK